MVFAATSELFAEFGGKLGQETAAVSDGTGAETAHRDAQLNMAGTPLGGRVDLRVPLLSAVGAGACLLLTLAFLKPTAAAAPTVRATVETMLTLFGLAAAWLVRGRFLDTRRSRDLLLLGAVLTLALVHLFAEALPAALDLPPGSHLAATALCGELFAAALFAAAATMSRDRPVLSVRYSDAAVATVSLLVVAVSGLCALLLRAHLVGGLGVAAAHDPARHPLALAIVLATAGLFAYAATGFARDDDAGGTRDGSLRSARAGSLLSGAALLLAAASLSQLTSTFAPHPVAPTEGLRLVGLAIILGAAVRWESEARNLAARAGAIVERQRVARDLHDSLAQDLACIAAHSPQIAEAVGADHPVAVAARRALQSTRSTIIELSDPAGATAHEALEAVAGELRRRFEIAIAVDVQLGRDLPAQVKAHVSRIVREAIANAARHGDAEHVVVSLRDADGVVRLQVRDDGCGIQISSGELRPEGFGLRSIRERASAMGGYLMVGQARAGGTVLDVVLP